MIIGITTTLNEADGFQRVNVEYINRVAATGAVPILLTPIAGGAEANREHARHVIELVDGLLITGGGDVHPRYYVPDPAKNRDALGLDDLAAMGCGSSSHCRSTGAKVPFCGHYVPDRTFEEAMDGTSAVETVESLDGRDVLSATGRPPIPCLDGLLAVCEDRDGFELELARLAHERSLPTLGICRGMQVMNVALGGSLYRDLYNCGVTEKQHRQNPPYYGISHKVTIAKGSLLESVVSASGDFEVNSMHHQGVDHVAPACRCPFRGPGGGSCGGSCEALLPGRSVASGVSRPPSRPVQRLGRRSPPPRRAELITFRLQKLFSFWSQSRVLGFWNTDLP